MIYVIEFAQPPFLHPPLDCPLHLQVTTSYKHQPPPPKEAEAKMDQHEVVGFGYRKKSVEFQAYDGRTLQGRG